MKSLKFKYHRYFMVGLLLFVLTSFNSINTLPEKLAVCQLVYNDDRYLQEIPSIEEVHKFFNNKNLLLSYREGEVIYGTYYFLEIHYCPTGQYGLYGNSVKKTVLGNEQRNSWQEFGVWKVKEHNRSVGIYYSSTTGQTNFVPIYRNANGQLIINDQISIVNQGIAICQ